MRKVGQQKVQEMSLQMVLDYVDVNMDDWSDMYSSAADVVDEPIYDMFGADVKMFEPQIVDMLVGSGLFVEKSLNKVITLEKAVKIGDLILEEGDRVKVLKEAVSLLIQDDGTKDQTDLDNLKKDYKIDFKVSTVKGKTLLVPAEKTSLEKIMTALDDIGWKYTTEK